MTSGVLLGWQNLADAGTLTTDSELTSLPAQNLLDPVVAKKWRTGAVTSAYILADLGSAQSVSAIALLGHNLTAAGTWRLRGSATDPTATGSLSLNVAASATGVYPDTRPAAKRFGQPNGEAWSYFTAASIRYLRLDLADASLSYLQAGRLVVMDPHEFSIGVALNPGHVREDGRLIGQARGGQEYVSRGPRQRRWRFSLEFMTVAEGWDVADAMETLNGQTDDVLFCRDKNSSYLGNMSIYGLCRQVAELSQPEFNRMRRDYVIAQRL